MSAVALTDRYAANLHGVLSCYDRIIITGTLPGVCYAGGMTSLLYARGIRIFDCARFAEPLRDRIRERAQQVCAANGVTIEHVSQCLIPPEVAKNRPLKSSHDRSRLILLETDEAPPQTDEWYGRAGTGALAEADAAV